MKYTVGSHFTVIYLAKNGEITARHIKVLSENMTYLKVFCYEKGSYRTLIKRNILAAEQIRNYGGAYHEYTG